MLTTDRPRTDFASSYVTECDVQVRLLGGTRDREIIPLAPGNHSVGSGPKCTLRLRDAGVGPMHCLIARNGEGVRVRRWSSDTLLNGQPFVESALVGGDYLSIGPVDLEIIAPTSFGSVLSVPDAAPEVSEIQHIHDPTEVEPTEFDRDFAEAESEFDTWPQDDELASDDSLTTGEMALARDLELPGIGFEILSALQSQREQFDQLLGRVDDLERKVELALADAGEPEFSVVSEYSSATATPPDDAAQISPFYAASSLDGDRSEQADEQLVWTRERADLIAQNANLEADLTLAQQQLSDAITELGEAQATIDDLQTRLAGRECAYQELSDEQVAWQHQLADLERQLAAHTVRTDELQQQLNLSKRLVDESVAAAAAIEEAFEDERAPVWPSSSVADEVVVDEGTLADEKASEFEDVDSAVATHGDGYDWSAPSVDELAEPNEASTPEEYIKADAAEQIQTAWRFDDTTDAAADESVQIADEEVATKDGEPVSSSFDSSPVVEPTPIVDKSTALNDTSTRLSGDIGEALAHLRELSIWRRVPNSTVDFVPVGQETSVVEEKPESVVTALEPDADVPSPVSVPEPVLVERPVEDETASSPVEEEPAPEPTTEPLLEAGDAPAAPATSSYIERYAHMFEGDERQDERESEPEKPNADLKSPDLKEIMQRGPKCDTPSIASAPAGEPASEADDSMEQYMARMMQRIRGDLSPASPKSAPATAAADNNTPGKQIVSTPAIANAESNKTAVANAPASVPAAETLISLQELKRKEPTPEFSTDMGALRALANQTARHAIGVHTARTLRRNSRTKLIVSALAAMTSLFFMLKSDDWQSYEFITGCVALFAAIYWGRLTFVSVMKAVKVGAFDDFDEDFTPIESAKEALPIDVARR